MDEIKIEETQVAFDYNKLQMDTAYPCAKDILKIIGESSDLLILGSDATAEAAMESVSKVSQKILESLIVHDVSERDMQMLIDLVQSAVQIAFGQLTRQKQELEKELYARVIGQRDPGTGKLSKEYSTIAGMFKALEAKRIEQDAEGNQYFIVNGK